MLQYVVDFLLLSFTVGVYILIAYFFGDQNKDIFESFGAALFFFLVYFFTKVPFYFFIPVTLLVGFLFADIWYAPTVQLFIFILAMNIGIFALGFLWGIFDKSINLFNYFWLKSNLRKDKLH